MFPVMPGRLFFESTAPTVLNSPMVKSASSSEADVTGGRTARCVSGRANRAKKTRAAVGRWSAMKKKPKLTELRTEASSARTLKTTILRRTLL